MAKSVLKRAKHLLKRSLATSIALVVAMIAVSLSLATRISYAAEQTLTESGVTVTGDFDKTIAKLTVTDWTNAAPHDNETYDSLKGYIEEGYEELKALELDVSPMDAKNTSETTITFTLGDKYNGREARVWYHDTDGMKVSANGTVTDGKLTVIVKNLETFMITLKQVAATENEPGDGNNENGTGSGENNNTSDNNTSDNNNENADEDNGNASGNNNNNSSKKNSKGNVKTGDSSLALIVSSIGLLTISATGMLLFKKKREARHFN